MSISSYTASQYCYAGVSRQSDMELLDLAGIGPTTMRDYARSGVNTHGALLLKAAGIGPSTFGDYTRSGMNVHAAIRLEQAGIGPSTYRDYAISGAGEQDAIRLNQAGIGPTTFRDYASSGLSVNGAINAKLAGVGPTTYSSKARAGWSFEQIVGTASGAPAKAPQRRAPSAMTAGVDATYEVVANVNYVARQVSAAGYALADATSEFARSI